MKKIAVLSFIMIGLWSAVFAQDVKVKDDKMKVKDKGSVSTGNYKATYSSNFQMGSASNVQKIMDVWQDWDDNMLDRHDYFADTLTMYFSNGEMMKGKAENLAAGKKHRGSMNTVATTLSAVVPLKSNDRNQDVVAVWGTETNTYADGKVEKRAIHEVWFFNKDGKIASMRQWTADMK